ncbi:MAG TPA: type II toxin-antitoxin system PemK/MazF family toxin [Ignavibacteria bacterium]|nr:type II toxin-antitoxin system PemK/MazF family toxin [Ignavibacteria bacterium]
MKQKDLYFAVLEPIKGQEQGGKRPVLILSGNTLNNYSEIVIVCPLSSKLKGFKGTVKLNKNITNGLKNNSEILVFQIRVVSKSRILKKIGEISDEELKLVKTELDKLLTY